MKLLLQGKNRFPCLKISCYRGFDEKGGILEFKFIRIEISLFLTAKQHFKYLFRLDHRIMIKSKEKA